MKKMLLLAGLTLLSASFALAQDTPSQSPSQSMPSQSDQTGSQTSNNNGTIKGCLSGSDGNYTLAQDETGAMFKLMGADDQLRKHVGHEVMITGQVMSANSGASASDQTPSEASAGGNGEAAAGAGGNTVQVSGVKMVSKHCSPGTEAPQSH
jgi:hypothetical protein